MKVPWPWLLVPVLSGSCGRMGYEGTRAEPSQAGGGQGAASAGGAGGGRGLRDADRSVSPPADGADASSGGVPAGGAAPDANLTPDVARVDARPPGDSAVQEDANTAVDSGFNDGYLRCRYDLDCDGGLGARCSDDSECRHGSCCTTDRNCGAGMCTLSCASDADCPVDMACEHSLCWFRCSSDAECATGMSCWHRFTICEWH